MRELGRCILVLLLVLGVPLKTLAATSGIGCLQGHGGPTAHAHDASHALHDAGAHAHAHAAIDGTPADADAGTELHSCSACAPCCAAAAPAPDARSLVIAPPSPTLAPHVQALTLDIVADVPHRPPR